MEYDDGIIIFFYYNYYYYNVNFQKKIEDSTA